MADNSFYITAGLAVPKDSGQSPGDEANAFYITAGLAPEVEAVVPIISAAGIHNAIFGGLVVQG